MQESKRKLAAILAADVAGYSRLMGADEEGTVAALDACRAIFRAAIESHDGRVVDTAGDSVLATFDSVVEAVRCSVEVQEALSKRNADLPNERRMLFRIGVNLGDVIAKVDGTIYGDGVNVAARLESLAEPGGVTVSEDAHRHVEGKTDLVFEDIGEHEVKNIARPVRAYRVGTETAAALSSEKPLALPDKPSIAVLPFTNLSGELEQEYFADGIAEDLITALSRIRWLFVTARNSTFTYKGRAVDVKEIGSEMGVRYVVEGSVRRGGERVRITVQLVDAATGNHIWAERYDRDFADIFALQDEITESLVATLQAELGEVERERAHRKAPESLDAWEACQKGFWHVYQITPEDSILARTLFRDAITRTPDFAPLHAGLAYAQFLAHVFSYPEADLEEAMAAGRRAVRLDDRDAMAHFALGRVLTALGEIDNAVEEIEAAIGLNPSFSPAHHALGYCRVIQGRNEEAIAALDMAIRLSPRDPALWAAESVRAGAHAALGNLELALADARNASRRPKASVVAPFATCNMLISVLGLLGRKEEAQPFVEKLRHVDPDFQPETAVQRFGFVDRSKCAWYIEGLAKAGVPPKGWQNS